MEIRQIANHIVNHVRKTHDAFRQKGLPYEPQIIARAVYKELKAQEPSLSEEQFSQAIEFLHEEGLAVSKANGLVFFDSGILKSEPADA